MPPSLPAALFQTQVYLRIEKVQKVLEAEEKQCDEDYALLSPEAEEVLTEAYTWMDGPRNQP